MARTNPAIITSIAAGLLLAAGPALLSAEPVAHTTYSWMTSGRSGSDTTFRFEWSITDAQVLIASANGAPDSRKEPANKQCPLGHKLSTVQVSGAGGNAIFTLVWQLQLDPKMLERAPTVVHPNSVLKQKPLKPKALVPQVHSKKRLAAPDQPWETEFLVWNFWSVGELV